jgi:hypothetical protein
VSIARRIPRPSAALVVAFAAMFTALTGTGYAALKITGASIVNGTVTGTDVKNKSLGAKEHRPDSLGGAQIKESALGTVPGAQHAATADNASNAQVAAKAADADKLGGAPADAYMTNKPRAFEWPVPGAANFANNAVLASMPDREPGVYVVTAKLTYDNDGATSSESCTLHVPGADDTTSFIVDANTETIMLQKVTSSDAVFNPTVTCTGDGSDDLYGAGRIAAIRLD